MAFIIYSTTTNSVIGKANCLYSDEPVIRDDEILIPCAAVSIHTGARPVTNP